MRKPRTQHQGFTLIELMITLTVLAVVLGIGLPTFRDSIARNNVVAEANRLMASINFARSQAVTKDQVVTLANAGGTAKDWSQGGTIFSDFNNDGSNGPGNSAFAAPADIVLKTFAQNTSQMTVRANTAASSFISFNPNGRIIFNAGALPITVAICDSDLTSAIPGRTISVSGVGRTSISTIDVDDKATQCIPTN